MINLVNTFEVVEQVEVLTLAALVSLAVPTNANEITAEFLKKEPELAHSQYINGSHVIVRSMR